MKFLIILSMFVVTLKLSFAWPANSSTELDYDNYIDSDDDDDYTEGPLERLDLDDEDSDVHVIAQKDDLRQIIFNPRKRRERRRRHRGKCFFFVLLLINGFYCLAFFSIDMLI